MAIDPVCRMEVNENAVKPCLSFEGVKYTFCSDGCRAEFQRRPQDYLRAASNCCESSEKEKIGNM